MDRIRRLLGRRVGWIRLALLVCALGYLLQQWPGLSPADAVLAIVSTALTLAGGRLPLTVVTGQSALLVLAHYFGHATPVGIKVLASVAVFEVVLRRWGPAAVAGALALASAYVAVHVPALPGGLFSLIYRIAVVVGGPVLLAAYFRSVEQVARGAREQAAEAERAARMAERTALARELHDIVAHHMASMALRVGVARHVIPETDPRVTEVLDDVHASATTALGDLRRLLAALRDPADAAGRPAGPDQLTATLEELIERARHAGLTIESSVSPDLAAIDAVRGLAVLRLVQEGLTNVVKHAGPAASVRLAVHTVDDQVRLEIRNDAPDRPRENGVRPLPGAGHGLLGMRERVDLVGGTLQAGPTPDGWRLAAVLPQPLS
ncbi:sensor histidine kinase [Actinoallomurus iriomotensis]|uniref:sensor histidine kinase n=1 Tax=Actinoallomurus iriomotensis TaxID=478107 RepID=UPI002552AFFA|nr:histidine kinase [Actinoallomurus iriomotensis]